jgi:hypothetical protein
MGVFDDDDRNDRTWGLLPRNASQKTWQSYLLLVRDPLTFGHSQLNVKCSGWEKERHEWEIWAKAATEIRKAIHVFCTVFREGSPEAHFRDHHELAAYTQTSGSYLRTLVLRASADEKAGEYKVHLVPYFKSHERLCAMRFMARCRPLAQSTAFDHGGLLGWLGERENANQELFDLFLRPGEKTPRMTEGQEFVEDFGLPELADEFRRVWKKLHESRR